MRLNSLSSILPALLRLRLLSLTFGPRLQHEHASNGVAGFGLEIDAGRQFQWCARRDRSGASRCADVHGELDGQHGVAGASEKETGAVDSDSKRTGQLRVSAIK